MFDAGGNVFQWNEQSVSGGSYRGNRGGSFFYNYPALAASDPGYIDPTVDRGDIGFRVASLVPEPTTGLLLMAGVLGLAAARRTRASACL
jgi:hypothetical protein